MPLILAFDRVRGGLESVRFYIAPSNQVLSLVITVTKVTGTLLLSP
jgi:hypothetical protein